MWIMSIEPGGPVYDKNVIYEPIVLTAVTRDHNNKLFLALKTTEKNHQFELKLPLFNKQNKSVSMLSELQLFLFTQSSFCHPWSISD